MHSIWNRIAATVDHLLWTQQWYLLYRKGESSTLRLDEFQAIAPPRGSFWADPFLVEEDGRRFVFFEELRYRFWGRSTGSFGRLLGMEQVGDGWSRPFPILERDYHLSYPFTFRYQGQQYLIPESAANRTIQLYRAVDFPTRWELQRTLIDHVEAVDTTLYEHAGKWWMFTCMSRPPGADGVERVTNRDLHVYFTEDPVQGVWTPHPMNPVVRDKRCARPAGKIFQRDGQLYRPGQDCSGEYGAAVELRRIRRLDEHGYEEEPAARITAEGLRDAGGVHTWNEEGSFTVADARRKVGRWNLC